MGHLALAFGLAGPHSLVVHQVGGLGLALEAFLTLALSTIYVVELGVVIIHHMVIFTLATLVWNDTLVRAITSNMIATTVEAFHSCCADLTEATGFDPS